MVSIEASEQQSDSDPLQHQLPDVPCDTSNIQSSPAERVQNTSKHSSQLWVEERNHLIKSKQTLTSNYLSTGKKILQICHIHKALFFQISRCGHLSIQISVHNWQRREALSGPAQNIECSEPLLTVCLYISTSIIPAATANITPFTSTLQISSIFNSKTNSTLVR